MSNITITLELKPSQELITLFTPIIAAIAPANANAAKSSPAPVQQYRQPVNPTIAPQSSTPATAAMPAPTAAPARMPYPSNPAPVNPIYAPTQCAPVNPSQATPMQNNPQTGAANMAPNAGTVPSQLAPTAPSTNQAPTATTPAYQFDDLARAAAQLMDAGKQQDLLGLIGQFGIQSMQQLPKERYGEFATALRQMGARI